MNVSRSFFILPLVATLAACGGSETPPAQSADEPKPEAPAALAEPAAATPSPAAIPQVLEAGKSWTLARASDAGLNQAAAGAGIFIEVQEARIVGYGGCNRFSVPLHRGEGQSIKLEAVVSTKRACASEAMNAAEQAFLRTLAAAQDFEVLAEGLRLSSADGNELEFSAGRPAGTEDEASQGEGT